MSAVFVTGGSGFLGINFVRKLLLEGHDVISYDLQEFRYPERARVKHDVGDIRDKASVIEAMKGANAVVHAAAALPLNTDDDIKTVDIDGTRNVIAAASALGITRFIHISSTAVYGVPTAGGMTEESPMVGVGAYGKAKIVAEEIVSSFRDEMIVTIIRPKSFIGPERLGVFSLLYDWASTGHHFPIPGRGNNLYQYLDVEDLCEALYLCLQAPETVANDTYNIGAVEYGTFRSDFQAVLDRAGFGKKVRGLPVAPVIGILRVLDRIGWSPLYPWVYETAVKDSFVSIDRAMTYLNWKPKFSNQEALIRNYDWYVLHKSEFGKQSGTTHRVPWKQGALGLAKAFFR